MNEYNIRGLHGTSPFGFGAILKAYTDLIVLIQECHRKYGDFINFSTGNGHAYCAKMGIKVKIKVP